jgi:hypothetical protein
MALECSMNDGDLLSALGQNIFNRIIEDTNPGDEFLLSIIDPVTFRELEEETGDIEKVDKALKSTGRLYGVINDDYVSVTVAMLQVILIYSETNITDDSFYSKMKSFYPNLRENQDVLQYFKDSQEALWESVRKLFEGKKLYLRIPPCKSGSGRYVQFPKSQQLIRWRELVEYADKFRRLNLAPNQIFAFDDFCNKVDIPDDYQFSQEENEAIKKIIFSFYNKWDGRPSDEIRSQRFKTQNSNRGGINRTSSVSEITVEFNYEAVDILMGGHKISENGLLNKFVNEPVIPFFFNEEYSDYEYAAKTLHNKDRLLVLVNERLCKTPLDNFKKNECDDLKMKHFRIFLFESCNIEIAMFVNLNFAKNEIYTIIGGITVAGNRHLSSNVIGCWYNFALPRIKINLLSTTRVFIDSRELIIEKNQVDLSNLILKESGEKCPLESGEHSFKCTGVSPAYFVIQDAKPNTAAAINQGWIITANELRPIRKGEKPCMIGLTVKNHYVPENANMRPFLSRIDHLKNGPLKPALNAKIRMLEWRKNYGC